MLVYKAFYHAGIDARSQDFHHHRAEISPAASVDEHGLVSVYDQIRVAAEPQIGVGKTYPKHTFGDLCRL